MPAPRPHSRGPHPRSHGPHPDLQAPSHLTTAAGKGVVGICPAPAAGTTPKEPGLGHSHPGGKQPREEFPGNICQPCPAARVLIQGSQGCGGPTKRPLPSLPPAARGKAGLWRPRGVLPASHRPGLSWPNALVPLGAAHLVVDSKRHPALCQDRPSWASFSPRNRAVKRLDSHKCDSNLSTMFCLCDFGQVPQFTHLWNGSDSSSLVGGGKDSMS